MKWAAFLLLAFPLMGLAQNGDAVYSPAQVWSWVYWDLKENVQPDARRYTRYLSLANYPASQRERMLRVLTGHVNSLSTEPDIIPLMPVPKTGGMLLRLNLLDYGWKAETWEKLAEIDPWFHVQQKYSTAAQVTSKGYVKEAKPNVAAKQVRAAIAPWLGTVAESQYIAAWTKSAGPLLRGDWFLSETAVQDGKKVGYYGMLGVKNQKDWEKLVRFNDELARKLEQRRIVIWSGITLQPRRIERTNTVLGGLWRTFDSADAVDNHNPLVELDDTRFKFDATEQFAPLLNGWPAWLLADAKGTLQAKAPDNVVGGDRFTQSNDTRLHVNLSCIRCHFSAATEQGIKDIQEIPIGSLASYDYEKLRELRRQYLRDIGPDLAGDRIRYEGIVKVTTGMSSVEYGQAYQGVFHGYVDAKIGIQEAARDLGCTPANIEAAFQSYGDRLNPVLSVIANGGTVPQRLWEEAYPSANEALLGVHP